LGAIDELDKRLVKYDLVENTAKKIGIRRAYLVLGIGLFFVSFILFGFGSGPLCNLVGFIYPLYASFKAINSERKDDDSQWLTYWVVYAFFTVIESFTDLFLFWIPFYYFIKMAFLLWCYLPQFEGSLVIYKKFIDPYLESHAAAIEFEASVIKKSLGLKKLPPSERVRVADANASPAPAAAAAPVHATATTSAPASAPSAPTAESSPAPAPDATPAASAPDASHSASHNSNDP